MSHSQPSVGTVTRRAFAALRRAEFWTAVAGVLAVLVAVLAWWFPQVPGDSRAQMMPAPLHPATATTGSPTPATEPSPDGGVSLNTLTPQAGAANLGKLPRPLDGKPEYAQPIVFTCPTNQNGDQVREVTYPLRQRYLEFTAVVRPYFPARADARTNVFAIAGFKERDGTMTRQERGRQLSATTTAAGSLAAGVEDAEELTLQVRCEEPDGVVVLTAAALTRAP